MNIKVIRFRNNEVLNNIETVITKIKTTIENIKLINGKVVIFDWLTKKTFPIRF